VSENFQTTRNVIARMGGMEGTIEIVNNIEVKRMSDPIPIVKGDGRNQVQFCHDPAKIVSPVTFEIIMEKDKAFGLYVRQLFDRHLRNPKTAQQLELRSYDDDGNIVDTATMPEFVFQSVKGPDGDTMTHKETRVTVVGQPRDWL
jgi:hypothetical protein